MQAPCIQKQHEFGDSALICNHALSPICSCVLLSVSYMQDCFADKDGRVDHLLARAARTLERRC